MDYLNKNLEIIEDLEKIDELESILFEGFKTISDKISGIIGYQGGNDEGDFYWSHDLGIWFFSKKYDDFYWNAFGTKEPVENGNNSITSEINLMRSGVIKKRAGAFARDDNDEFYLVHSGKIGGGKKGFGKKLFFEKYEGKIAKAFYNGQEDQVAVIGKLNNPDFYKDLKNFVYQIEKIKNTPIDNKQLNVFFVAVSGQLQDNYRIGIKNRVWAVKEKYINKIKEVKKGDYVLFYVSSFGLSLCSVLEEYYHDTSKVWPDDIYPNRIKISKPLFETEISNKEICKCMVKKDGKPFDTLPSWQMGIMGANGVFKKLSENEIDCLFDKLGWDLDGDEDMNSDNNPLYLVKEDISSKIRISDDIKDNICALINSGKHVLLTGPPGTGKTDLAKDIANAIVNKGFANDYILTTATSDWTTFDTIGGYMPDKDSDSLSFYEGKFLQAIGENKSLIIDEINRSDIDKAFGQLFTVLSGQGVELPFVSDSNNSIKIIPNNREIESYCENGNYIVGKNWRIIATMNVFDKNYLFEMSYAFMRRFAFVYIDLPSNTDYKALIRDWSTGNDEYIEPIENLLRINEFRPLGPAIFKDICEFVNHRVKLLPDDGKSLNPKILADAFISFISPQLEGLEFSEIENIWKSLDSYLKNDAEVIKRFEETGFQIKS